MPSKREQLLEIMEDAAKGETKATLRARIAELEAENERLQARNLEHEMRLEVEEAKSEYWKTSAAGWKKIANVDAEALSRTGAVKVKALVGLEHALCEFTNAASDQYDPAVWIPETKRNFEALCDAYNAAYEAGVFYALEPAAPVLDRNATNDQIAAVMLQHGNEDQRREALAYAGIAAPEGRREAVGVAPAQNELDFAAAIAEVVKEGSAGGAACGWHPCTGCHGTNEGYETGLYPYSKMFGCYVGSGCSECGGLGVVWEYFSEADLDAMSRRIDTDVATHANPAQVKVDALAQEIRRVDGNHDLGAGALAEALMPFLTAAIGAGGQAADHIADVGKMVEPVAPESQQEPVMWQWRTGKSSRHTPDVWDWTFWREGRKPDHVEDRQYRRYEERPLYTRPSEQAVTEAGIEAAARHITKWLGFAWDGLHDGRVTDQGFPIFTHGQFGWGFQGHKGDMIDLARAALKAAMEAGR